MKRPARIGWILFEDDHLIELNTRNLLVRYLCAFVTVIMSIAAYLIALTLICAALTCWMWIPMGLMFAVIGLLAVSPSLLLGVVVALLAAAAVWFEKTR